MTEKDYTAVAALLGRGHSPLSAARCLTNVHYREIEREFGPVPHPEDRMSPALRAWWTQQPWVWRPDNPNPITAPWERITA